jgi:polysaccharide biosynthesis/export protein
MHGVKRFLASLLLLVAGTAASAQPPAPAAMPQTQSARPAAPPTAASRDVAAGYVLGADDVVEITVLGQPEFTTRARVKANGTIQLPFIGEQQIAGETALSLAPKIATKLRNGGYYAKPVVNVEIANFASRYVTLLGAVGSTGLQPVDRDYRLSEVLARAGGIRQDGADFVVLTRADGTQQNYQFDKLAAGGPQDDPVVSPGDKVFVPLADTFYVQGQVNAPGEYPIRGGPMTVRKAVARAGGVGASGSLKRVKIFRNGEEIKAEMEMPIQKGDVIVVGERLF